MAHRQSGREAFQDAEAEGLRGGGGGQHVQGGQQFGHVVALAGEHQSLPHAEFLGPALQRGAFRALADQHQPGGRVEPGERLDQHLEALAGHQPAHPADRPTPLRQADFCPHPTAGGGPFGGREAVAGGVDAVRDQLDPGGRDAPGTQCLGDLPGDRDSGAAEPFGRQVEALDAPGDGAALDHPGVQRVLGGDHRAHPGQPGGQPTVQLRPVEVGVHQVVAAGPDQPDQPGQRAEVPVAAHVEVVDGDAVGAQRGGDRARVGQGEHLALLVRRQVSQQQVELALGAAGGQSGDDVQHPHGRGSRRAWRSSVTASRSRCRPCLARSRQAPSRSPT